MEEQRQKTLFLVWSRRVLLMNIRIFAFRLKRNKKQKKRQND